MYIDYVNNIISQSTADFFDDALVDSACRGRFGCVVLAVYAGRSSAWTGRIHQTLICVHVQ